MYKLDWTTFTSMVTITIRSFWTLKWTKEKLTLSATYSFVNISKLDGVQVSSTSPHAATASLDYRLRREKYGLGVTLSASFMGSMTVDGVSREAYFRTDLPSYAICNLSVSQTFFNFWKLSVGVDNIFDYVPETLGSGVTMFNVPATPGARGHVQVELLVDEIVRMAKTRKAQK